MFISNFIPSLLKLANAKDKYSKKVKINVLFGYNEGYEFHGPLELIFYYLNVIELNKTVSRVCKNFYLAAKYSYVNRRVDFGVFERFRRFGDLLRPKELKSFDLFLNKLNEFNCIEFSNECLVKCSESGLIRTIENLLKNPEIDPSYDNNKAIIRGCYKGCTNVVKLLLKDNRVDPSDNFNKAIRLACMLGFEDIVNLLLKDKRVDPSKSIIYACIRGNSETVKLLLNDPRVNPSYEDNLPIRFACDNGYLEIVKLLLQDPRVNPSDKDNEALINSYKKGYLEIVELLLQDPRVTSTLEHLQIISS